MKLNFKATPEQLVMLKDMASKNRSTAEAAQEAFAAAILPVAKEVINNISTTNGLFETVPFDQNCDASIPLDTYFDEAAGLFSVWSQNTAGGLPTNFTHSVSELKISTYNLYSAVSFAKKYVERSRLDVVGKAITRLMNEMMIRQDFNGWAVLLKALALASTNGKQHIFRTTTSTVLILDDLNKLLTRGKRINTSYANGTPDSSRSRGVTDLFLSPEVVEQIRAMAYNPMNTRQAASGTTSIAAPEQTRQDIFNNGGASQIYNITLHELNELGIGYTYNTLFARLAGSTAYVTAAGASSATFAPGTNEVAIGVDTTRTSLVRPVEIYEGDSELALYPDDQFPSRSEKLGFVCKVNEGRVVIDDRAIQGLII